MDGSGGPVAAGGGRLTPQEELQKLRADLLRDVEAAREAMERDLAEKINRLERKWLADRRVGTFFLLIRVEVSILFANIISMHCRRAH